MAPRCLLLTAPGGVVEIAAALPRSARAALPARPQPPPQPAPPGQVARHAAVNATDEEAVHHQADSSFFGAGSS